MKILIVSKLNAMPVYRHDDYLISYLLEKGVEVSVITDSLPHKLKYEEKGATVILHHPSSKVSLKSITLIRKALKELKPDILYLLNSKAVATGAMAAVGLPVKVIAYRGAAGIYWHDPTAYLAHFNPRVDIICCLSRFIQKEVAKNDFFSKREYAVVHKGMSADWIGPRKSLSLEDYKISPADITIACVANLRKVKGVQYLLQAVQMLKTTESIRLVLIGDKTDSPEFQLEIKNAGLSGVVFGLGFKENVYDWIDTCDIYVQPSLSEGLGKSILEAMAMEKAIITTRSGGPEELIEDGKSGIVVPVRDPGAIAKALQYMFENPEERRAMAVEAKERVISDFSLETFGEKMYNLFKMAAQGEEIS